MDTEQIEEMANRELAEEELLAAVKVAKQRIRDRKMRPLLHKIFPFIITITRR